MTTNNIKIPASCGPRPVEIAEGIQWRFLCSPEDNAILWRQASLDASGPNGAPPVVKWVSQVEAARIIAFTPRTLRNWRKQHRFTQGTEGAGGEIRYAMPDLRRVMVANQFAAVRHAASGVLKREHRLDELHAAILDRLDRAGLWTPDAELAAIAHRLRNPTGRSHVEEQELYRALGALPLEEGLV